MVMMGAVDQLRYGMSIKLYGEDKAFGPGALDMKGGAVISLYAIKVLKHLGYQESPIKIIFSGNEEKGHQGSTGAEVFLQEGKDCLFAFNMETGLMDGCLCVGRKGHLGCRVTVEGVESHAGNDFESGRSAIEEAAHEVLAIQALTDLEEGKRVSWSVEYCGIRKEVKDPKGTTIISMKEMIERSREFLDALKKTKDKNPCCYVKPKVEMKTKGNAATYKGKFGSLEEARASDKVICLIPSNDGRIYELRKMEQGEFIAPKNNVTDFAEVRAGFTPALPKIPGSLMGQIIAFFRAFMTENEENEALALIYWDKVKQEFFAYVPKQTVCKVEIEANLHDCPYDDAERYICYADIHSHNSMDAFFSSKDDSDERSTGLYFVLGKLDQFYPDIKARIFCGDTFVPIDPDTVIEGLEQQFPVEWLDQVTIQKKKGARLEKNSDKKWGFRDILAEVGL